MSIFKIKKKFDEDGLSPLDSYKEEVKIIFPQTVKFKFKTLLKPLKKINQNYYKNKFLNFFNNTFNIKKENSNFNNQTLDIIKKFQNLIYDIEPLYINGLIKQELHIKSTKIKIDNIIDIIDDFLFIVNANDEKIQNWQINNQRNFKNSLEQDLKLLKKKILKNPHSINIEKLTGLTYLFEHFISMLNDNITTRTLFSYKFENLIDNRSSMFNGQYTEHILENNLVHNSSFKDIEIIDGKVIEESIDELNEISNNKQFNRFLKLSNEILEILDLQNTNYKLKDYDLNESIDIINNNENLQIIFMKMYSKYNNFNNIHKEKIKQFLDFIIYFKDIDKDKQLDEFLSTKFLDGNDYRIKVPSMDFDGVYKDKINNSTGEIKIDFKVYNLGNNEYKGIKFYNSPKYIYSHIKNINKYYEKYDNYEDKKLKGETKNYYNVNVLFDNKIHSFLIPTKEYQIFFQKIEKSIKNYIYNIPEVKIEYFMMKQDHLIELKKEIKEFKDKLNNEIYNGNYKEINKIIEKLEKNYNIELNNFKVLEKNLQDLSSDIIKNFKILSNDINDVKTIFNKDKKVINNILSMVISYQEKILLNKKDLQSDKIEFLDYKNQLNLINNNIKELKNEFANILFDNKDFNDTSKKIINIIIELTFKKIKNGYIDVEDVNNYILNKLNIKNLFKHQKITNKDKIKVEIENGIFITPHLKEIKKDIKLQDLITYIESFNLNGEKGINNFLDYFKKFEIKHIDKSIEKIKNKENKNQLIK
jgi:hypothetical protein